MAKKMRLNTKHKYIRAYREKSLMQMTYMHNNTPCTVIDIDFARKKIKAHNYTNNPVYTAFGIIKNPTWNDFENFLKDRCFPQTRGHLKWFLNGVGVDNYDPLQIIEKTHGRCAEDNMWIKIKYRKNAVNENSYKSRKSNRNK